MTTEKKDMLVTILSSIRAILNTVVKNGIFKTIIISLIDAAIEVINDEDIEKKGSELLKK